MTAMAILAEDLACQRGGEAVVSGLSFEVRAGNALVLRGPNGSGKTTLLRTIAGFLPRASGRIRVIDSASELGSSPPHPNPLPKGRGSSSVLSPGGEERFSVSASAEASSSPSPPRESAASSSSSLSGESVVSSFHSPPGAVNAVSSFRTAAGDRAVSSRSSRGESAGPSSPSPLGERVGVRGDYPAEPENDAYFHYIGHANGIKPRLSVIENVSFWARYYDGGARIEAIEAALDAFGLLHLAGYRAAYLSQGQARRLGLARLLAARRPIWLLDEPSVSLDAASTALLESAITRHLSSGGIAIVSTHMDLLLPGAAVLDLGSPPFLQ